MSKSVNNSKKQPSLAKASAIMGRALVSKPSAKARKAAKAEVPAEVAKVRKLRAQRQTKAQADAITIVKSAATGNGTYVEAGNGASIVLLPWQDRGKTKKLAVIGGSLAALREHLATLTKPTAKLANGVDPRTAPHSAKAVADQRNAAPAKAGKPSAKAPAPKAEKNKQPSNGQVRKYKRGTRKDESRDGTFRKYMLSTIMAHKDTASAKAAHAKSGQYPNHKLDFNWSAQQGYIVFTA